MYFDSSRKYLSTTLITSMSTVIQQIMVKKSQRTLWHFVNN